MAISCGWVSIPGVGKKLAERMIVESGTNL